LGVMHYRLLAALFLCRTVQSFYIVNSTTPRA
jgi:hypothetical protein